MGLASGVRFGRGSKPHPREDAIRADVRQGQQFLAQVGPVDGVGGGGEPVVEQKDDRVGDIAQVGDHGQKGVAQDTLGPDITVAGCAFVDINWQS